MKFTLAAITLLVVGYYFGDGVVREWLYRFTWQNPVGDVIHNFMLHQVDDIRVVDFYGAIRLDWSLGPIAILVGFASAIILRRRFDLVATFLLLGVVGRMWVPLVAELVPKVPRAEAFAIVTDLAPDLAWDIALLPGCLLGTAVGRFVKLRRLPRCGIRSAGLLMVLLALVLMAISQEFSWLLPFAMFGLLLFVSIGLLIQTDPTVETSPIHPNYASDDAEPVEVDDASSPSDELNA